MDIQKAAKLLEKKLVGRALGMMGVYVWSRPGPYSTTVFRLCVDLHYDEIFQISYLQQIPTTWHGHKIYFWIAHPSSAAKEESKKATQSWKDNPQR